jgi:glycosyltransferase involved in cell wall biosynthesis
VTLSATGADRLDAKAQHLLDHVDSVYFLLIPGWESELRANRWQFAIRWAKRKPVVLVTPDNKHSAAVSVPEPRIPNCRILSVQLVSEPNVLAKARIQVAQVLSDMTQHHFAKALLWCYNPDLADLFARVPAVARLHHASEAYFDMPGRSPAFHQRLRAVVEMSDLTVAVSDGVAAGILRRIENADVVTVPNGCDYRHYSTATPDISLTDAARAFERVAVYAGNINGRLDFGLLHRLASTFPRVLFAFYGPRIELSAADANAWQKLTVLPNVIAPGPVDPDRIRDLYAAADVGIIPYRQDPWLVENGLPLKALEMGATGLPVVSSLMKPLLGMAAALVVTSTADQFIEAFARTSRARLSESQARELSAVSSANDYDNKFEQILTELDRRIADPTPSTRVDVLSAALGAEWTDSEARYSRWLAMPLPARMVGTLIGKAALLLPAGLRRRPALQRLRAAIRVLLGS